MVWHPGTCAVSQEVSGPYVISGSVCRMFSPARLPLLLDVTGDSLQHLSPLCKTYTGFLINFPAKMQCRGEETYAQCGLAADGAHQDALEQLSKPS